MANPNALPSASELRFDLFPNLPTELRLRVWQLALPAPRTVTLSCHHYSKVIRSDTMGDDRDGGLAGSTTIPCSRLGATVAPDVLRLLHANQEARAVAWEAYGHSFGPMLQTDTMFIDLSRDILFVSDWGAMVPLSTPGPVRYKPSGLQEVWEHLRYIAIDPPAVARQLVEFLRPFERLEIIALRRMPMDYPTGADWIEVLLRSLRRAWMEPGKKMPKIFWMTGDELLQDLTPFFHEAS